MSELNKNGREANSHMGKKLIKSFWGFIKWTIKQIPIAFVVCAMTLFLSYSNAKDYLENQDKEKASIEVITSMLKEYPQNGIGCSASEREKLAQETLAQETNHWFIPKLNEILKSKSKIDEGVLSELNSSLQDVVCIEYVKYITKGLTADEVRNGDFTSKELNTFLNLPPISPRSKEFIMAATMNKGVSEKQFEEIATNKVLREQLNVVALLTESPTTLEILSRESPSIQIIVADNEFISDAAASNILSSGNRYVLQNLASNKSKDVSEETMSTLAKLTESEYLQVHKNLASNSSVSRSIVYKLAKCVDLDLCKLVIAHEKADEGLLNFLSITNTDMKEFIDEERAKRAYAKEPLETDSDEDAQ